jgi:hypothetical protein
MKNVVQTRRRSGFALGAKGCVGGCTVDIPSESASSACGTCRRNAADAGPPRLRLKCPIGATSTGAANGRSFTVVCREDLLHLLKHEVQAMERSAVQLSDGAREE